MIVFEINDMTCSHCAGSIYAAVSSIDPNAEVKIDLAAHRVRISSGTSGVDTLKDVIRVAGYSPILVADGATGSPALDVQRKTCCG